MRCMMTCQRHERCRLWHKELAVQKIGMGMIRRACLHGFYEPANLVPHVGQRGVCQSTRRDHIVIVQPRIVLQIMQATFKAK